MKSAVNISFGRGGRSDDREPQEYLAQFEQPFGMAFDRCAIVAQRRTCGRSAAACGGIGGSGISQDFERL